MAYRLELPPELSRIHNDFRLFLLKKYIMDLLIISKLNILINPCTKNNKLLGIIETKVESSRIEF